MMCHRLHKKGRTVCERFDSFPADREGGGRTPNPLLRALHSNVNVSYSPSCPIE